jgi:two-component system, NarL family, captular synthesis response regulator RcsB
MIEKVLIVEDHESANLSVQKTLELLGIKRVNYCYYCDDALAEITKANDAGDAYDLLITDLSFEPDQHPQKLQGGTDLIRAARHVQEHLRVLVFSAESKASVIESLYKEYNVDGYVRKARNDAKELKVAIEQITQNQAYMPRQLSQLIKQKNAYQFTNFDIVVIRLLANGTRQKDIPAVLQQLQVQPSGLSSVEKRLSHIREELECSNNEQLVAFCKDKGII